MTEKITKEIFEHIVDLAALELKEEESEYIRKELNDQLKSIEELEAIPLDDDVQAISHGIPYTQAISAGLREDRHDPFPNPEEILDGAPLTEDGFFVVPDIPHEDLS